MGASEYDSLYVDASLQFSLSGSETFSQQLLDFYEVPVCGIDEACPADGQYAFGSNFTFPEPVNDLVEWAASGYKADVVVEIFFNGTYNLVGRCQMGVKTETRRSTDDSTTNAFKQTVFEKIPSGRIGGIIALAMLGTILLCCSLRICFGSKKLRTKEPLILPGDDNVETSQTKRRSKYWMRNEEKTLSSDKQTASESSDTKSRDSCLNVTTTICTPFIALANACDDELSKSVLTNEKTQNSLTEVPTTNGISSYKPPSIDADDIEADDPSSNVQVSEDQSNGQSNTKARQQPSSRNFRAFWKNSRKRKEEKGSCEASLVERGGG